MLEILVLLWPLTSSQVFPSELQLLCCGLSFVNSAS